MKVKALARELGRSTKELIGFLIEVDINVNSGATKLDDDTTQLVRDLLKGDKQKEDDSLAGKSVVLDSPTIKVKALADLLKLKLNEVMAVLLEKGLLLNLNSELDQQTAQDIAEKFEITLELKSADKEEKSKLRDKVDQIEVDDIDSDPSLLTERAPVITILGHVDHGKTQLLDSIRKTDVIGGEAGGITQHIGAYQITFKDKKLTFLDTPGHAAFTALRARGAQVTDIVILVVAGDEGIKPQTVEAIHHAKAASVPIIVAVNKMDKEGADVENVKKELSEHDLLPEDWGGKTVVVPVSAKTKQGIDDLLEMILLTSEVLELKANAKAPAKGIVIEAHLSTQKGSMATVLIKSGTLKIGDFFVSGQVLGKVKALHNDLGKNVKSVVPGTPVEILGFNDVPSPGTVFEVKADEAECRKTVELRKVEETEIVMTNSNPLSLETLSKQIESGDVQRVNLIIKSDVHGSLEAIIHSIDQISNQEIGVNIIHSGTGTINENDVMLAKASQALVIAFNVGVSNEAEKLASEENVTINKYDIIYKIVDDLTQTIQGMFRPEFEEVEQGQAEVRQIFKYSKVGSIAGSSVKSGNITRNSVVRVFRDGKEIHKGTITSLKRFNEDTKEVKAGYECGIVIDGGYEVQENDILTAYELKEKKRS